MNRPAFEYYLREMLLPCLRPGQVLVIDNLSVHHGDSIETMVSEVGYSCSTCLPTLRT